MITDPTTEAEDTSTVTTSDSDQDQCKTYVLSICNFSKIVITIPIDYNALFFRLVYISATERTCPLESWHFVRSSNTAMGCSGFTSDHCFSLNNESTSGSDAK